MKIKMHFPFHCFTFFIIFNICLIDSDSNVAQKNSANFLHSLIPSDYDKDIRPLFEEKQLSVNISINVDDINSVSEQNMEFTLNMHFRQTWNDPRLAFSNRSSLSRVMLTREYLSKIYLPDTFFANSKKIDFHKTITDDDTTQLIIYPNGNVYYLTKVSVVTRCSFKLTYFPVDQQKCYLSIRSYSKPFDELVYHWWEASNVSSNEDIYLPTFRLLGYSRRSMIDNMDIGVFSKLRLEVYLSRNISFYFTRVYLPAFLVVIISFVPFWLDRDSHARVALGVTTVLTMTTLITNTNSELPKISHLTALDIYLFFCFFVVFLSLIEYAIVGYYDMQLYTERDDEEEEEDGEEKGNLEKKKKAQKKKTSYKSNSIDFAARKLFPLVFGVFNVVYTLALVFIVFQNRQVDIELKV